MVTPLGHCDDAGTASVPASFAVAAAVAAGESSDNPLAVVASDPSIAPVPSQLESHV